MFFFGLFALLSLTVLALVLLIPHTGSGFFYMAYATFIGLSMVLVVAALVVFPELLSDISDAATLAYSVTTLGGVDVQHKLDTLERLMTTEKLFANEDLNLRMTAQVMEISSHQLSELINTQFGYSFSRYIREQRVTEAKRLLVTDASASVLAVSLESRFRSQSNFYTAFREVCGEAPGTYRKRMLGAAEVS
jgi:AraC-like DNA-binding protein